MRTSKGTCTALLVMCVLSWPARVLSAQCPDLGESDEVRLTDYVRARYKVRADVPINLAVSSFVDGTCYRKIGFSVGDAGRNRRLELYLSPDLRFLTRELLDSSVDPMREEKSRQQVLSAGLFKGDFPSRGPANAPATLTVFSDFQCPYCARFATMLTEDILPVAGDKVRVVFRHLPLPMHAWARPAAEVAACAQVQGNDYFWSLHDYIFLHQGELTTANVREKLADQAGRLPGFNRDRLEHCLAEKAVVPVLERDIAFGREAGVRGTPTVFVNTQLVDRIAAPEQILTLIRQASQAEQGVAAASR